MEETRNFVQLRGTAAGEPQFSHENHGQRFCRFPLSVRRLSGQTDLLHVIATAQQLEPLLPLEGRRLAVEGQLRSFNNKSGHGNRLVISVFAQSLGDTEEDEDLNGIQLRGVICKPPVLRRTPLGRCISDMMLAVNRRYGRADYLPCIAWGQVAMITGHIHHIPERIFQTVSRQLGGIIVCNRILMVIGDGVNRNAVAGKNISYLLIGVYQRSCLVFCGLLPYVISIQKVNHMGKCRCGDVVQQACNSLGSIPRMFPYDFRDSDAMLQP